MIYRISKTHYNHLLKGQIDSRGRYIIHPLETHEAVVEYLKIDTGLMNLVDVVTD